MFRIGNIMCGRGRYPPSLHSLLVAAKSGSKLFLEHCDFVAQKATLVKLDCPWVALGRNDLGGADWMVHLVVAVSVDGDVALGVVVFIPGLQLDGASL